MREIWFALTALMVLAGAAPSQAQRPAAPSPETAATLLAVTAEDRVLGKTDAPVTIVEYASLTCPHCRHFETDVLPKLKEKWIDSGKAKLVYRDFPLDAPGLQAAMVARCAPPERYFAFIDTFFQDQEKWALSQDPKASLERLAQLGGMSKKTFEACLADKAAENKIVESRLVAANQLGVDSTPSFFVNNAKYSGAPTFEAFDQLLASVAPKS